ncbi:hypothetical protein AB8A05_04100 [Tardiphaga sp. 538_B7_N1_4]|uniref:hypothetical protein n=1 Tax=Tardiphaga sp. 538_B7_N1_4 TaxID=3240778 RepID=UPI003F249206
MFGTKKAAKELEASKLKIAELENNTTWLRQRVDSAEAIVAKKQTDDYENRSWVEQGKGTGIKTLAVSNGQLLRLEDGRTFFLPVMQMTSYGYGSQGGVYPMSSSQQIVPLG